jgi:hypothetical protein
VRRERERLQALLDDRVELERLVRELDPAASSRDSSSALSSRPCNERPQRRAISRYSRCSGASGVCASSSVMPRIALSGVRTSWLIAATNACCARTAASASARARRCSWTIRPRSIAWRTARAIAGPECSPFTR